MHSIELNKTTHHLPPTEITHQSNNNHNNEIEQAHTVIIKPQQRCIVISNKAIDLYIHNRN